MLWDFLSRYGEWEEGFQKKKKTKTKLEKKGIPKLALKTNPENKNPFLVWCLLNALLLLNTLKENTKG